MRGTKILIIRFSSIGDIVLTTPVIRCLKNQLKGAEIHFITKEMYKELLEQNPYIDTLITFKTELGEVIARLKNEHYDLVIDLHKNLRSFRLKKALGVKSYSFNKLNFEKFLAVNLKLKKQLPDTHIVERYFETLTSLGVKNDGKGLDYFIGNKDVIEPSKIYPQLNSKKFIALVIGGSYFTKQIPLHKLVEICNHAVLPIILLGGKGDLEVALELQKNNPNVINSCAQLTINQSASVIQQAEWVITSDTGLMHIAAAFHKKIISVWGNTIPEFGMSPYAPNTENKIIQNNSLPCRPCSKLGYKKCPKGHFKCMNDLDVSFVAELK